MKRIMNHPMMRKYGVPAILALLGAASGYLYYRFVGCTSGSCAITSNPYISTVYGSMIGFLLGIVLRPDKSMHKEE